MNLSKRAFLGTMLASAAVLAGCGSQASAEVFEVNLTPDQWRRRLTPQQFRVLREAATERAFDPLNDEHRRGTFLCAGCDLPIYRSQDKFDSGTGWPSFTRPIAGAVRTRSDSVLLVTRPRSSAVAAVAISATSSRTARRRPASAGA
jgi:peptide-methionine (R)-S-oxide reductase